MNTSNRFAMAVHIMAILAHRGDTPTTSEQINVSVKTAPTVVRRLLSMLAKAGLTRSALGKGGGATLARAAERITLADIYRAVEPEALTGRRRSPPNPQCLVGRNILAVLDANVREAEAGFFERLARASLDDVLAHVLERAKIHGGRALI